MATPTKIGARGLLLRKGIWHIDKVIYGKRVRESTQTSDRTEAEALLAHRSCEARRLHLYGRTFLEAGVRFVAESQHLRGLERDERALAVLYPFIGSLPLQRVHRETLEPFVQTRLDKGLSPDTVNRELAVVRRILNLASRVWRDETGRPWLADAPLIPVRRHLHPREPYPLSVGEQQLLFSELSGHLKPMALFKVNTGLREQEVVNLRWEWEVAVPELDTSVFVIPRDYVKNVSDRYVVLNRIARSVIEKCRGNHPEFVFTYRGNPVTKFYNSGWKAARRRAAARYECKFGRPCPKGFRAIRVHDLKHSYGFRLRGAGVSFEDRQLLLGHKMRAPMTTHYSAAEVGALIEASERVCELESRSSPAISVVRGSSTYRVFSVGSSCSTVPGLARPRRPRGATLAATLRHPASPRPGLHVRVQSFRRFDETLNLVERASDLTLPNSRAESLESVATPVAIGDATWMGDAAQQGGGMYSQIPLSVRDEARDFAEAHGMSFDQFVAAAVREKVASLCATETGKYETGHWRRPLSIRQE